MSFNNVLGGNLKKLCIVWPPISLAAIPFLDRQMYFLFVFFFKYSMKEDLPVPALPYMKHDLFVLFTISNAFFCCAEGLNPCGSFMAEH